MLLHAGQNKASVLAPRYSCAGVFYLVTRQTDLPKEGEEGVMGNTLGGPLQEDAQQGAWLKNEMTFEVQESCLKSLWPVL